MPRPQHIDRIISARVDAAIAPVRRRVAAAARDLAALDDGPAVRDAVLDAAISERRIAASERDLWADAYDEAPAAATRILASLRPGAAPETGLEVDEAFWAQIQPGVPVR